MPKFFITTTIPLTLGFFKGNLKFLSKHFDVCAISSEPDNLSKVGEREGVRVHCIPMERPISIFKDVCSLFHFIKFFIKEKPTIVHGNTPKASMLSMFAGWLTRVPVRIYMCHGLRYQGCQGLMRKLLIGMEKLSCSCATEVICVTEGVRDTLVKDGACSAAKGKVIGYGSSNGVDVNYFSLDSVTENLDQLRTSLQIAKEDFVFAYGGRIVQDKGINELISAFNRLQVKGRKVHLLLIGKEEKINPITDETRQIIASHPNIHALGWQSDIRPYIAISNAFVLPSYREGLGMVLLEAASLGVPSIASDIIGCNDIIIPNKNGDLVPAKDTQALYEKMQSWIERPDYVKKLASSCRKFVIDRYEKQFVWESLLKEYERLSNGHK